MSHLISFEREPVRALPKWGSIEPEASRGE